MDTFAVKGGQKLRCGYTTGSCAAAAAKAAAVMALTQTVISSADVTTPRGAVLKLNIEKQDIAPGRASCAVRKDSGDDPDITDGILVYAAVRLTGGETEIVGGEGIGKVTKPGLACPVGSWAINPAPRRMIEAALAEVRRHFGYGGGFGVELSIPGGRELAQKTFNPRLGIEGGLSILGTTGIVDPMSEDALVKTIHAEMESRKAAGCTHILAFFGNYGVDFSRDRLHLDVSDRITISNYVGEMLDYAAYCRFSDVLLVGHIGKLVKLAQGIMNTHSKYGDGRTSFLALAAMLSGASPRVGQAVYDCVTTDEALRILQEQGLLSPVMELTCQKIDNYMAQRVRGKVRTGAILFSHTYGVLGYTSEARKLARFHMQRR